MTTRLAVAGSNSIGKYGRLAGF